LEDPVIEIVSLIPRPTRLELFRLVYKNCNSSPNEVAKILKMNPRQVYFYLSSSKRTIRNYPNDLTTLVVLKVALQLAPIPTKNLLNKTISNFVSLLEKVSA